MEIIIKLAFYDIKWFLIKQKSLFLYKILFTIAILVNLFQILLLLSASTKNKLNSTEIAFLYISLVELMFIFFFLVKIFTVQYLSFKFLHKAHILTESVNMKMFDNILRDKVQYSFIGFSNGATSLIKLIFTLLVSFDNIDTHFTGISKSVSYCLFGVYQSISLYFVFYFLLMGVVFAIVKGGFILFCFFFIKSAMLVQKWIKTKSELDTDKEKTIANFQSLIQQITSKRKYHSLVYPQLSNSSKIIDTERSDGELEETNNC